MSESSLTDAEVLAARARRLARPAAPEHAPASTVEVLGFTVGRERYAIESRLVYSVARLADLVPLPGAQAPVVGLTRWRGDVLTILDLRGVVGGAPRALDDLGKIVVIGEDAPLFGLLADTLDDLLSIDMATLHPLSATRHVGIPGLLRGVTSDAIHVVDAEILIAHQLTRVPSAPSPSSTSTPGLP